MSQTTQLMGRIGLPAPIAELVSRPWDAIVIGAGHNGLACAAYLASSGKRVLVLEANERVGGACTLEEPWPGYRISPCAYLCGLLHPLIVDELDLPGHGFEWIPASAGMFVPFDDGSSIQLWNDAERCDQSIRDFSPGDLAGWREMGNLVARVREAIRPATADDTWASPPLDRSDIEARVNHDPDAIGLLYEWSMAEFVERYLDDERLHVAMLGQGVIGTSASPFDPGTAYIRFHHASGRMFGRPGEWGYVKGGMGTVSFILCDIAQELGATVAAGVPVGRILPGEGVELEAGEIIRAQTVISNADPRRTLRLLGDDASTEWTQTVKAIPSVGHSLKLNVALSELPNFEARPGLDEPHHRGQINTVLTKDEWRGNLQMAESGDLPGRLWTELYFQSALDDSVVPPGKHVMSVFAQYVPYAFEQGDWDSRRQDVVDLALSSIGRYAANIPDAVEHVEVMGPPDIESKIGITGGHIFHGDCLPAYMGTSRLSYRTPIAGLYLCGAGTHPGGSVIGVNGRNAAMCILEQG